MALGNRIICTAFLNGQQVMTPCSGGGFQRMGTSGDLPPEKALPLS